MSEIGEQTTEGLARPYTVGTFQTRLNKFEDFIKDITFQDVEATPEERRQMITESLRFDQFCESIRQLFGSDIKNSDLKAIYRKISTNPDAKVDWSELFGYFQSNAEEHEEVAVGEEISIFTVSKRKRVGEAAGDKTRRDTVQCLRYVPILDSYVSASQKGAIAIWNSSLRLQVCIDINEPAWVTGCDFLPNIRRVVCCTERSIAIWDNRAKGKNQHLFSIKPFENSPQCICHIPNAAHTHEDVVLFGDDQGYVNILRIVSKDLTTKNAKDAEKIQNTQPIPNYPIEPDKLTHKIVKRKIHHDWVLQIKYFPELRCFGSCSPHSKQSFVLEEIDRLRDDGEVRGVSIYKGVNCFDYCAKANIIATGGVDKVIRVWHPHIFSRPTGKLMGHLFTIVDISCNEKDQHLISLSTARVFRVWDIHTLTCLQVFTDNEERPGEKRIYSMIFDNKHERLLTGSSVIDSWPLTRAVQDTMQVPHTHDRPISQILLNKELNQVITVCTESNIKVWELETGNRVATINNVHGDNIEVTAMCLDKSGYRLATGAFDGSVKVWDFGSGQVIKTRLGRQTDEDLSIIGLFYTYLEGDRVLVTIGWNNKIRVILDTNENYDLPVVREFSDVFYFTQDVSLPSPRDPFQSDPLPDIGQNSSQSFGSRKPSNVGNVFKKDYLLTSHDITCMESFENILLTGCSNGSIILWDIEKSMVDKVFDIPEADDTSSSTSRQKVQQGTEKKVTMIKVLIHRERKLDPAYVKKKEEEEKAAKGEFSAMASMKNSRLVSRANSRASRHSNAPMMADAQEQKALMDEITAKIEGVPLEKKEGEEKDPEKVDSDNEDNDADGKDGEDGDDKKDGEKSDDGQTKEDEEEEVEDDKYITEIYDPIIVSTHQDSYIRFWTLDGHLLREISAITRRQGTPVTAICHDENCNILISGDQKGYLTMWNVAKFLKNPDSTETSAVKQVMCWRAHLMKVVSLVYIDALKTIYSGSADGSVRVWWGNKGRFIGFFSQHRPFVFPKREESAGPPTLPYDITEGPLAPVKAKSEKQKIRPKENVEFPLVVDYERWLPFRRSAYARDKQSTRRKKLIQPEDKKFFGALIKPKEYLRKITSNRQKLAYNHHLESFSTADKNQGAVFRALPVYRIKTPKKVTIPEPSYKIPTEDESTSYLFGGGSKDPKAIHSKFKTRTSSQKPPRITQIYLALKAANKFKLPTINSKRKM